MVLTFGEKMQFLNIYFWLGYVAPHRCWRSGSSYNGNTTGPIAAAGAMVFKSNIGR